MTKPFRQVRLGPWLPNSSSVTYNPQTHELITLRAENCLPNDIGTYDAIRTPTTAVDGLTSRVSLIGTDLDDIVAGTPQRVRYFRHANQHTIICVTDRGFYYLFYREGSTITRRFWEAVTQGTLPIVGGVNTSFAQLGSTVLVTVPTNDPDNANNRVSAIDLGSVGVVLQNSLGTPLHANVCSTFRYRGLVAGDLANPDRLYYSAINRPNYWLTTRSSGAGSIEMPGTGEFTGMISTQRSVVVFREASIIEVTYVGGRQVFSPQLIERSGTISTDSIVEVQGNIYFHGYDGFYVLPPGQLSIPISGEINEWFRDRVTLQLYKYIRAYWSRDLGLLFWSFRIYS